MTEERINTGYAALQTDSDDVPVQVHGVAIGENDVTRGGSGKETLWPRETLEGAAEGLMGQPLATDTDHTADDPSAQTPVEAIAGEVTWAGYKPGVGVLYEAEVDDPDLATKIENGRVEVSPLVSRDLEALEDGDADYQATEIKRWRDLALVSQGAAPSNEITVGGNPMKAEALHEHVTDAKDEDVSGTLSEDQDGEVPDAEALKEVAGVEFDGTAEGELDESEIPNDDFESHYLYPADTKSESSYPVVSGDGTLQKGNVDAAWGLGARGGVDADELDSRLLDLAQEFDTPPEWAEGEESMGAQVKDPATWEACSLSLPESLANDTGGNSGVDDPESDEGPYGGSAPSSADSDTTETMTDNDLTDEEKAVLSAAESLDEPVEALEEYATAEQPRVVEQDEYEAMQDNIESVRGVMEEALVDRTDLKEETVSALDFEALRAEFETEDGDLDAEALVQNPETGDPETPEESGVEALGEDADVEKAEALMADYETFGTEGLKDDITEALGVSDFEEAEEVLN